MSNAGGGLAASSSMGWVFDQRGRGLANAGVGLGGESSMGRVFGQRVVNEAGFYPLGRADWMKSGFVDEWPETASAKAQVGALPFSAVVNEGQS